MVSLGPFVLRLGLGLRLGSFLLRLGPFVLKLGLELRLGVV
jgi:hypothetical protein